jgi:hypothetical protein
MDSREIMEQMLGVNIIWTEHSLPYVWPQLLRSEYPHDAIGMRLITVVSPENADNKLD